MDDRSEEYLRLIHKELVKANKNLHWILYAVSMTAFGAFLTGRVAIIEYGWRLLTD